MLVLAVLLIWSNQKKINHSGLQTHEKETYGCCWVIGKGSDFWVKICWFPAKRPVLWSLWYMPFLNPAACLTQFSPKLCGSCRGSLPPQTKKRKRHHHLRTKPVDRLWAPAIKPPNFSSQRPFTRATNGSLGPWSYDLGGSWATQWARDDPARRS